jgi:hypothetical protein
MSGRGVLLDVARAFGRKFLPDGFAITNDILDYTAQKQGVEVRRGDFLLVHTGHIERCLTSKSWGGYSGGDAPGPVERLEFSSTRALTGGSWTIDLVLKSSTGRNLRINEYYEFSSGFLATEACRNAADAFSRAVQNLVGKTFRNPQLSSLIK